MKAKYFIRFLTGTVLLVLFNFHIVCSENHTERIPDDARPKTKDYYTYCMSHRDYGIDVYELNEHTFISDLDGNEFQFEVKPSCNFSRRLNDTDIRGVVIHYTNGSSLSAYSWWQNQYPGTSAHYIINRDGSIIQSVPEIYAAYHIGCYWSDELCGYCPDKLCGNKGYFFDPEETTIEDITVNGLGEVMTYSSGGWDHQGMKFESSERLLEMINRGISKSGKKANPVTPIVDAILPGGERVSIVTYPVTDAWQTICIRAHRSKDIQLSDFTKKYEAKNNDSDRFDLTKYLPDYTKTDTGGMLSAKAAAYLHAAVLAGLNIVMVGPTGCGKTTMLTALGKCIPPGKRILIIEDTPEIDLNPGAKTPNNVIYLRTRAASLDGNVAAVEQADLVKLALRQRPDALTLGEARGKEVFDLLNALNTGHKNGLTSLHAEGLHEVFGRIFMMLSQSEQGRHLDRYRAANLAAGTLNILVTLQIHGSRRSVHSIVEYSGKLVNEDTTPEPEIVPIFLNESGRYGDLGPMLRGSCFAQKFEDAGMPEYTYTTQPLP